MVLVDVDLFSILLEYLFLRMCSHDMISLHIYYHQTKMGNLFSNSLYKIENNLERANFSVSDESYYY